ncbi:MAG: DUF4922 domain-containing protein [Myxococcales bacterium]|nr:DUF4922 domain-containing protein [Myxococcales bacterium]
MSAPWEPHLITPDVVAPGESVALGELLPRFLDWQAACWPRLATALAGLSEVEQRSVQVGERSVRLQFNPGRAVNSTAKVDAASIRERPCFLCAGNLPPEEKGLPFGNHLVILANPAPILPQHFVLAHREHTPQRVSGALEGLVAFAVATEGAYTAVYNGPASGASAPDHLHLQAVASGLLGEEVHAARRIGAGELPGEPLHEAPGVKVWSDTSSGRWILGAVGSPDAVVDAIRRLIGAMPATGDRVEPPLNLLAVACRPSEVMVLLFVRDAHRPRVYFADEPERRLVSPGAIDMAGVVVTVRREDYNRLRPEDLTQIFSEVSPPPNLAPLRGALDGRI